MNAIDVAVAEYLETIRSLQMRIANLAIAYTQQGEELMAAKAKIAELTPKEVPMNNRVEK